MHQGSLLGPDPLDPAIRLCRHLDDLVRLHDAGQLERISERRLDYDGHHRYFDRRNVRRGYVLLVAADAQTYADQGAYRCQYDDRLHCFASQAASLRPAHVEFCGSIAHHLHLFLSFLHNPFARLRAAPAEYRDALKTVAHRLHLFLSSLQDPPSILMLTSETHVSYVSLKHSFISSSRFARFLAKRRNEFI